MPQEKRQNLAEADNQGEWLEEFFDDKGAFCNGTDGSESDDSENDDGSYNENIEAVVRRCFSKYGFLNISQISQETPVLEFLFNKVEGPKTCNFIKTDSKTGVFLWYDISKGRLFL